MKILKLIFNVIFKTLFIILLVLNYAFVLSTHTAILLFDEKTDMTNQVINNYHNYIKNLVEEKFQKPNMKDMLKANVFLMNLTKESLGAGVIIKKNSHIYILTVTHLGNRKDEFVLIEDGKTYSIEVVRFDKEIDLALFKFCKTPTNIKFVPISKNDPSVGDTITCIGNPNELEDAVTTGTIMQKTKHHYYITAPLFMGSSGGGLYNTRGELVGINSSIKIIAHGLLKLDPTFTIGRSIRLKVIKKFLGI